MSHPSYTRYSLIGQTRLAYEKCLIREGIPSKQYFFYCVRANQFIKEGGNRDPGKLEVVEISEILVILGRDEKLSDWQFVQMVDAVRILLTQFLQLSSSAKVDWSYWKGSARSVSGDHAITAREHSPDELSYLKVKKSSGVLSDTRKQHRKLIVRLVTEIRTRGYSYRTEEAYEQWVVRYIFFCNVASPEEAGADHVAKYLNDLVVSGNVSASTQNQALNALIFLYKQVLRAPLGQLENFARPKRKKTVPVVMSRPEVKGLLQELDGWQRDVGSLLYGTGMRVMDGQKCDSILSPALMSCDGNFFTHLAVSPSIPGQGPFVVTTCMNVGFRER